MGVNSISIVDSYDLNQTELVLRKALEENTVSVLIAKNPCIKEINRVNNTYQIVVSKCNKCGNFKKGKIIFGILCGILIMS